MFVIYSLGVTLAGNSQAMRRETSLPHYSALQALQAMMSYVSLLVTIKHHLEEGSIGITRERCEAGDPEREIP